MTILFFQNTSYPSNNADKGGATDIRNGLLSMGKSGFWFQTYIAPQSNTNVLGTRRMPLPFKRDHDFRLQHPQSTTIMTTAETEIASVQIPPGIYHIVVASHGAFTHQRLTDREHKHVTISPPSAKPDPSQKWHVLHGSKPRTTIIERPGSIRPPIFLTYKGDHEHPKEGEKVEVRRGPRATDWELDPAPGHRYYIRAPHLGILRPLGIAVAPEKIDPPYLEIDHEDQLQWIFERVPPHGLEEEEA